MASLNDQPTWDDATLRTMMNLVEGIASKKVVILRVIPGSGKSTFAETIKILVYHKNRIFDKIKFLTLFGMVLRSDSESA